ncbi:MAG: ArsC/Spx/MgsR family protein [Pseudomonadota bacterium]
MVIFGLKSCDACRKARKALPDATFVDVRDDGVPPAVLGAAMDSFSDAIVNTRSTTWREITEEDRARPPEALIAIHPTVMKRPLIVVGDQMYLGWTPATRAALGVA